MNYDAMIRKHLKGLEETYGAITKDDTRDRAREMISAAFARMGYGAENASPKLTGVADGGDRSFSTVAPVGVISDASISFHGVVTTSTGGTTTVYPIPPPAEEPAIEGDLPGATGTFYAETMQTDSPPAVSESVPELIGGWPNHSLAKVMGLAPNRRMLKAFLPDSRIVSVERKEPWKAGEEVKVKLMRAGSSPLYRMVARGAGISSVPGVRKQG